MIWWKSRDRHSTYWATQVPHRKSTFETKTLQLTWKTYCTTQMMATYISTPWRQKTGISMCGVKCLTLRFWLLWLPSQRLPSWINSCPCVARPLAKQPDKEETTSTIQFPFYKALINLDNWPPEWLHIPFHALIPVLVVSNLPKQSEPAKPSKPSRCKDPSQHSLHLSLWLHCVAHRCAVYALGTK